MATANLNGFFRRLTRGMAAERLADHSDRQLVERALAQPDAAALEAVVHRHGPMVYRVRWRVLQHSQDAEDAFQATFLVLAQKLRTLRKQASLASWLHGVARRVALKAKARAIARRRRECQSSLGAAGPPDEATWRELRSALDFELSRLPDKWRLPLILCYLEGRTQDESASQLGWSKSTLRRRLEDARAALGCRLNRRGIVWPAALAAVLVSDSIGAAAPAPGLVAQTVEAAAGIAAGKTLAASAKVAALTNEVLKAMFLTKLKIAATVLFLMSLITIGGGLLTRAAPPVEPNVAKDTANDDAVKKDMEAIQGTWAAVVVERDGVNAPAFVLSNFKVVIKGNKMTINPENDNRTSTFQLDPSQKPKVIYNTPEEGPAKGKKLAAIYELDSDTLKMCFDNGSDGKRPTEFKTTPKSGLALFVLKRQVEKKPPPQRDAGAVERERKKFAGAWQLVSLEAKGKKLTRQEVEDTALRPKLWHVADLEGRKRPNPENVALLLTYESDGRWKQQLIGDPNYTMADDDGTSAIDIAKTPKTIDQTITSKNAQAVRFGFEHRQGQIKRGIYEFADDDTLRLCFAQAGNDRPDTLVTKTDSEHVVWILQRIKKEDGPAK